MTKNRMVCNRRAFLRWGTALASGIPLAWDFGPADLTAAATSPGVAYPPGPSTSKAKVAIVPCKTYGPEVRAALKQCFDLLGGIGQLVKNKTVTVKMNLTGSNFMPYLGRPVGETYMTHYATVLALGSLLFEAGAKRMRFVESTCSRAKLESTLSLADWDLNALLALGQVEFENTRNLGLGKSYAKVTVPHTGHLFSSFALNHSYADTDVLVSLAKLKQHVTAGVTLSLKNMFGITPASLYGAEAGSEDAIEGRAPLHSNGTEQNPRAFEKMQLPGLKKPFASNDPGFRVPRIVADICAACPVHLAIIDGITTLAGGEGYWSTEASKLKFLAPGLLLAGLNPVSTDAVGTAVMGYASPGAQRATPPFINCDNHLVLAEQLGAGTADLARIEVVGTPIAKAVFRFDR